MNFLRFSVPPTAPLELRLIQLRFKISDLSYEVLLNMKFHEDSKCFSKISPSNSLQCQKIWSGFEIRALRHEFLLKIKFLYDPIIYS